MPAFTARYTGRCAADCRNPIEPGDHVQYVDDELVHVGCQPAAPPRPAVVCTTCWLTLPCEHTEEG
jgi:hypothetical protein